MPQEPIIMNGGESPLASQLQSGAATNTQQLQSGATQIDGGPAPSSGQAPPPESAPDAGGAVSGGIMRPRSG
jgi:hypothetical protein